MHLLRSEMGLPRKGNFLASLYRIAAEKFGTVNDLMLSSTLCSI